MHKKRKQMWLKALRSGKYSQTRGYLKDEIGYCCLGVACDIYKKVRRQKVDWDLGVLPINVMNWLGLTSVNPIIDQGTNNNYGEFRTASMCNDRLGMTFEQIADLIEENL